jgi:hypothetical protein
MASFFLPISKMWVPHSRGKKWEQPELRHLKNNLAVQAVPFWSILVETRG